MSELVDEGMIALDDDQSLLCNARLTERMRHHAGARPQLDYIFFRTEFGKLRSHRARQAFAAGHKRAHDPGISKPAQEKKPPFPGKHIRYP